MSGKGVGYTSGINAYGRKIFDETEKIDNIASDGISGVQGSLAYTLATLSEHTFNALQWHGKDAGDDLMNRDSVSSWSVTAGTSQAYGTEVQISDGTEIEDGDPAKYYDLHRILITTNDAVAATTFKIEFWYGTGLFANSTLLTECVAEFSSPSDNTSSIELSSPRIMCNNNLWARVKASVNSKSLTFIIGLHVYTG